MGLRTRSVTRIVGLTGPIGAGKSTIARLLAGYGAHVVDADVLVRDLYETDRDLQAAIADRFGTDVVAGGRVDRRALAQVVFADRAALADLEALVHPRVFRLEAKAMAAARAARAPACVLEAIRIVESGGSARCDELWIVVATERVQLARLAARGVDETEARRRLATQGTIASWSDAFFAESGRLGRFRPILVLDNNGPMEQVAAEVQRLWAGVIGAGGAAATPVGGP